VVMRLSNDNKLEKIQVNGFQKVKWSSSSSSEESEEVKLLLELPLADGDSEVVGVVDKLALTDTVEVSEILEVWLADEVNDELPLRLLVGLDEGEGETVWDRDTDWLGVSEILAVWLADGDSDTDEVIDKLPLLLREEVPLDDRLGVDDVDEEGVTDEVRVLEEVDEGEGMHGSHRLSVHQSGISQYQRLFRKFQSPQDGVGPLGSQLVNWFSFIKIWPNWRFIQLKGKEPLNRFE
jgi:hypothetical protein